MTSLPRSQVRLFADDCLLYRTRKCRADQEKLQRDLSALHDWTDRWGFEILGPECVQAEIKNPGILVHF